MLGGLHQFDVLLRAVDGHTPMHDMHHPQFAALHMSMSAISLQWLSSTRPGGLLGLQDSCFAVCRMATLACTYGLMQQQRGIQAQGQQQAVGGCTHCTIAIQAVAKLSAVVLGKLLSEFRGMWQGLHNSGESSAGGSANSSSDGSEGSSSAGMLLQSCHSVVTVLARTFAAAVGADNTVAAQQHNSLELAQLPVSHAQCCKLLQDYVRLAAAAAAAEPSSTTEEHFTLMLGVVAAFLGDVVYQSDSSILLTSGPLVARIAAAGDVSSPDALQLFGLVCSWLKLYTASGGDTSIAASRMLAHVLAVDSSAAMDSSTIHTMDQQTISTAVLAAVSSLVKAAIGGGDSSGMYSGSSSSTGGSKACKAVLPWLVLIGRSCSAWA